MNIYKYLEETTSGSISKIMVLESGGSLLQVASKSALGLIVGPAIDDAGNIAKTNTGSMVKGFTDYLKKNNIKMDSRLKGAISSIPRLLRASVSTNSKNFEAIVSKLPEKDQANFKYLYESILTEGGKTPHKIGDDKIAKLMEKMSTVMIAQDEIDKKDEPRVIKMAGAMKGLNAARAKASQSEKEARAAKKAGDSEAAKKFDEEVKAASSEVQARADELEVSIKNEVKAGKKPEEIKKELHAEIKKDNSYSSVDLSPEVKKASETVIDNAIKNGLDPNVPEKKIEPTTPEKKDENVPEKKDGEKSIWDKASDVLKKAYDNFKSGNVSLFYKIGLVAGIILVIIGIVKGIADADKEASQLKNVSSFDVLMKYASGAMNVVTVIGLVITLIFAYLIYSSDAAKPTDTKPARLTW